jgi:hypothetical protein
MSDNTSYLPTGRTPGAPPPDFDIILCDTKVRNENRELTLWFDFTEGRNQPSEEAPFSLTYTLKLAPKEPGNGPTTVLTQGREIESITAPKEGIFVELPMVIEDQSIWKLIAEFSRIERNGEAIELELWENNIVEGDLLKEENDTPLA